MSKSVAGTQPKSRSTSLWHLSSQHNSATHGLDLLLGQGRDELGLDDNGLLGQLALAQHLGGAEGRGAAKRGVGFKCQLAAAGGRAQGQKRHQHEGQQRSSACSCVCAWVCSAHHPSTLQST